MIDYGGVLSSIALFGVFSKGPKQQVHYDVKLLYNFRSCCSKVHVKIGSLEVISFVLQLRNYIVAYC